MTNVTVSGIGEVLRASQLICGAQYRLRQGDATSGQAEITGEIVVNQAERMSGEVLNALGSGEMFTLRLDNGRILQVSFNPIEPLAGRWRVVMGPGNSPLEDS